MADAFVRPDQFANEFFYRLAVGMCLSCSMIQLIEEVPNEQMFHKEYPYRSSGSLGMRTHFRDLAQWFVDRELTGDDPFIVEIGCNDGVMLKNIASAGYRHVGVEPCDNLAQLAALEGVQVLNKYFNAETAKEIAAAHGPADVIFAANTFSHISDVDTVLQGVDALLTRAGVFVFEDPYFPDILEKTSFDQIYDEHIYFFTVRSIAAMADRYGFELVDAQYLSVHGGEVRYTMARRGTRQPSAEVERLLAAERRSSLTQIETLTGFARDVERRRDELVALLEDLKSRGKKVAGYGATAKCATMMNYCHIGPDLVEFICDNTPAKQGLYTPGTHVPVRTPEQFASAKPDYALLFAWNHAEEIMANEKAFHESGGRWIHYIPRVQVT